MLLLPEPTLCTVSYLNQVVNLLSGHVRTATADTALCDAAIAALAAQLPSVRLQHLSTLLHSLGKVQLRKRLRLLIQRP